MKLIFISASLFIALVATNIWWFIGSLDAGLAITQGNESFDNQSKNVSDLTEILLRCAEENSRNSMELMVEGIDDDPSVGRASQSSLFVNLLEFRFEGDRLVSIEHSY